MQRLFDQDQADRQHPVNSKAEGMNIYREDTARRVAAHKLLDAGALHTAQDFENAAFIFQHGDSADDYLLAHTLATIALAKGSPSAIWIVTATLDRYLNKIGQPQIYGTQYNKNRDASWTQEPYNHELISDALRKDLLVPTFTEQQKQLARYNDPKN